MIIVEGDFLLQKANTYVFSSNGVVMDHNRAHPRLVMGKGAAFSMLREFPDIDFDFGQYIVGHPTLLEPGRGVLLYRVDNTTHAVYRYGGIGFYHSCGISVGALQVKKHWRDRADIELLKQGVEFWRQWATSALKIGRTISMNFPGIGAGGLRREDVEPILKVLPDNVLVCIK